MGYTDPNSISNPSPSTTILAAWGDNVRDNIVWQAGDGASGNPKPMCRVYRTTAQSIPSATWTAVTFNAERYDTANMHSTSSNTSRLTVPSGAAGVYQFTASAVFAANGTGGRLIRLRLNTGLVIGGEFLYPTSGTYLTGMLAVAEYKLSAGDFVEVEVYQDSGGALNLNSFSAYTPEFSARWVGVG